MDSNSTRLSSMHLLPSKYVTEILLALFFLSQDQALLHGFIGVGFIGLLTKLHAWDDSAMFFDGTSLGKSILLIYVFFTDSEPMQSPTSLLSPSICQWRYLHCVL